MFSFQPFSDEQIEKIRIGFSEGAADFTVKFADTHNGKKGQSLKLELFIKDCDGTDGELVDYLSSNPKMAWKIKHFFKAIGLLELYEQGAIYPSKLSGTSGKCILRIQKGTNGYPDKMAVQDYLDPNAESEALHPAFDDDIPFG